MPALRLDEPQPGEVPVAAVRQRRDDAAALLAAPRTAAPSRSRAGPSGRAPPRGPWRAAGRPRTSSGRSCAARRGPARPARPAWRRGRPGAGSPAAAAPRGRRGGPRGPRRAGRPARATGSGRPRTTRQPGGEPGVGHARRGRGPRSMRRARSRPPVAAAVPAARPRVAAAARRSAGRRRGAGSPPRRDPQPGPPLSAAPRPVRSRAVPGLRSAISRAERCTAAMRCPTVHTDAAASSHSPVASANGMPRPSKPVPTSGRDQPLGPLDEAAVRGQPGALGARLDVGDDLPGDEADQGRHARAPPARSPGTTR